MIASVFLGLLLIGDAIGAPDLEVATRIKPDPDVTTILPDPDISTTLTPAVDFTTTLPPASEITTTLPPDPDVTTRARCCPNGWVTYENSCYLIGRTLASWQEAKARCKTHNATLFVPDSVQEWEAIRAYGGRLLWSWIGMSRSQPPPVPAAKYWIWETENGGMDVEALPWLNGLAGHGHSAAVNCVSYYNTGDPATAYINWYPCHNNYYYICERNLLTDN